MTAPSLDELLDEGFGLDVEAYWGAGFLADRYLPGSTSWSWPELVDPYAAAADALLDLGTGEGGILAALPHLPRRTVATEAWPATVPAAIRTLVPRGIHLVVCADAPDNPGPPAPPGPGLPFADASYDVVVSRHTAFDPAEVRRVLRPGGVFVTQQVGSDEIASVRALCDLPDISGSWHRTEAARQLAAGRLVVTGGGEERPPCRFTDVAALVGYLRTIPWSVPELDRTAMRPAFARIDGACRADGAVEAVTHRFWVTARRS